MTKKKRPTSEKRIVVRLILVVIFSIFFTFMAYLIGGLFYESDWIFLFCRLVCFFGVLCISWQFAYLTPLLVFYILYLIFVRASKDK